MFIYAAKFLHSMRIFFLLKGMPGDIRFQINKSVEFDPKVKIETISLKFPKTSFQLQFFLLIV